jgi:phospholipase/carboxylesterase
MHPRLPARSLPAEPQFTGEPNFAAGADGTPAPLAVKRGSRSRAPALPESGEASSATPPRIGTEGIFVPTGYEPGYAYPLLVWLTDPSRKAFDLGRTMSRVSLRNHVAVEPLHAGDADADRDAMVWQAIDSVRDRVSINPRRIFLIGQGAGGTEAFRIACRHATAFAGVVSIGGPFPLREGLFGRLEAIRQLPMLMCCHRQGLAEAVGPTDATLRLFHAAGAMLAMRIYPGHNDLSKTILADVNRWLMDEICGTTSAHPTSCGS